MIAVGKFDDGVVLVSDSRASYKLSGRLIPSDSLQKILPIGKDRVFCYSGSVNIVNTTLKRFKTLNRQKKEYQYLDGIIKKLPGLLKSVYRSSPLRDKRGGLSVIVGGKALSGEIKFWAMHCPKFTPTAINSHCVIGSGDVVKQYMDNEIERIKKLSNLKARADALMVGLSSELNKQGIESVGGMFQIVLISKNGIQPLNYGYINLDPESSPNSIYMEMKNGQWVQHNLAKDDHTPVVPPSILLNQEVVEKRVQDFVLPIISKKEQKWHLNYFITSEGVRIGPGEMEFYQPIVSIGSHKFPLVCETLLSIGFWGSAGKEKLTLSMIRDGERSVIGEVPFEIRYFPEDMDIQIKLNFIVDKPGPIFIEASVRGKVLGRRVMYFKRIKGNKSKKESDKKELLSIISKQLNASLAKQKDPVVESGKPELVYFFLCQKYENKDGIESFKKQFWVCYWNQYPLPLVCYIASAFRMSSGKHKVSVDLVDASNHGSVQITSAEVISKSSCLVNPVHGKVVINVPKPGYYFVNASIDGQLVSSYILIAETDTPKYAYTLLPEMEKEIKDGQLFLMVKRANQKED